MRKLCLLIINSIWLCNLHSQNWVNIIDSMPGIGPYFQTGLIDSVSNTMYLGGTFNHVNNFESKGIVKFDGVKFDTLADGLDPQWKGFNTPTIIKGMVMFQNKLYVSGQFEKAGKYYSRNLARWNGTDWDTTNFGLSPVSSAWYLKVYNNELYVAGSFDSIGGIKSYNIAKYDGTNWHDIGYNYLNGCVSAIEIYKGKLFMAGETTPGTSCTNLAYYDGITWKPWYGILGGTNKTVTGMKVIDDKLFVYGRFNAIGGVPCNGLACWDGEKWIGYGRGVNPIYWETIWDVAKIDTVLYASGIFDTINDVANLNGIFNYHTNIAKFTNNKWCTFLEPTFGNIFFTLKYKNDIYFGGAMGEIGTYTKIRPLLKWTGGNSTITCGKTVTFPTDEVPSISNVSAIYPNPTSSILNIYDDQIDLQNASIKITNSLGQLVLSISYTSQLDLSDFANGMYYLTLQDNSTKKTVKIIKQ